MKTIFQKARAAFVFFAVVSSSVAAFAAGPETMVVPFSKQTIIQPETIFCVKGSEENPIGKCEDATPCKDMKSPSGVIHKVCLAGTPNVPVGTKILSKSCWDFRVEYTCLQYTSDCAKYTADPKCTEVGTGMCIMPTPLTMAPEAAKRTGTCLANSRAFVCVDAAAVVTPQLPITCETTGSLNGLDWTTSSDSSANDFVEATTSAEIARQLAAYGDKSGDVIKGLFAGVPLGCRNKYSGLNNCCNESPSGTFTNSQVAIKTSLVTSGLKMGAGYAMKFGAEYVEDFVMTSVYNTFAADGAYAMFDGISKTSATWTNFTAGFGVYGFGFSAAGAASGIGSATGLVAETSSMALGQSGLYFNPYAFAIAIGIQVVMQVMSCDQSEKELANARKDNLCHYVGDYCSSKMKLLGATIACLETTTNYCCYNGLLGKAIQEGAHSQLGISWGSGESPQCGGMSPAQLSSLDFTKPAMKAALKPFQDLIMKGYKKNIAPIVASGAAKKDIQEKNTASARSLCLQRKLIDKSTVCK